MGVGPKLPGAKLGQEKTRIFETISEAIEEGYRYIPDDEALRINVQGAYNRVIDKRYADWLLDEVEWRNLALPEEFRLAKTKADRRLRLANKAIDAIQRARRGETLPTGTVNAIERLFPDLEGKIREPTRVRIADVLNAAKKLQEPERVFEVPKLGAIRKMQKLINEVQERLDVDPGNPALQAEMDRLRKSLGFIRYRIGLGEPLVVPHNVVKALRQDAIEDLDELLVAIRGSLVKRPGLKPRYEGGLIADIRKDRALAYKKSKDVEKRYLEPTSEERRIQAPAFAGKAFPKETAESIRKTLEPEFFRPLAQLNKPGAVSRVYMLGADLSPLTIHLLFLPGISPKIYAKAAVGFWKNMIDPKFLAGFLDKPENKAMLQKYPGLKQVGGGQTEGTQALGRGGMLSGSMSLRPVGEGTLKTAGLLVPRVFGKVMGPPSRLFGRGFEGVLDVAGIEMVKSLDHLGTTAAKREDIAQFANKIRGVASSARLGVSANMRQLESFSFLAGGYNRAVGSILADLLHGGLSGSLARKALIRSTATIMLAGFALSMQRALSRGKSTEEAFEEALEHVDPRSSKFMTWKIGNQKIGPGSKMRSIARLIGASAENPERLKDLPWGDHEYMRNPIIRFGRGLSGPWISLGWDVLTGRDFMGEPTGSFSNAEGILQMSETVAKRFMYIWVQTMLLEGGTPVDRLSRGATEFIGFRAHPTSPFERREERGEEMQKDIAEKLNVSGTYKDIINIRGYGSGEAWAGMGLTETPEGSNQQDPKTKLLMGRDPEYAEFSQRSREDAKRRGGAWGDYYQEVDLLWDNKDDEKNPGVLQELEALSEVSEKKNSKQPGKYYKLKRSKILTLYYHDKEKALERAKKRGAFPDDKEPEGPFEAAQDVYNRLLFADDSSKEYKMWVEELLGDYVPLEGELGFNWDERERRMEYLVRSYSQQFIDDMKDLSEANPTRPLPQTELTYRKDIEYITDTGYWNVDEELAIRHGVEDQLKEYKNLRNTNELDAKEYLDNNSILKTKVIGQVSFERQMKRLTNPDLDGLLYKYGYTSKPVVETLSPSTVFKPLIGGGGSTVGIRRPW